MKLGRHVNDNANDTRKTGRITQGQKQSMELNPENFKQEYYLQYFFRFNETLQEEWGKICGIVETRNTERTQLAGGNIPDTRKIFQGMNTECTKRAG